jgi:two-component system NtrC family sensor kinase
MSLLETESQAAMVESLREKARLASLRAEISEAFALKEELDVVLQACTEALVKNLGAAFARIWVLDAAGETLILRASAGLYTHLDGAHGRVRVGDFKIGRIAKNLKPHVSNSVPTDPEVSNPEWARSEGMIAFAGYPLTMEGKALGVVAFFSRTVLSNDVLDELEPIADGIAQWIKRKQVEKQREEALQQAQDARREAEILNRVGRELAAELELAKVVQIAVDAAREMSGAEFGVFFYNASANEGTQFGHRALSGITAEAFDRLGLSRSAPLLAGTFSGKGLLRINDMRVKSMRPKGIEFDESVPCASFMGVPVISRSGAVLGGIFLGHSEAWRFSVMFARLVEGIAAQAAISVDNAHLYEALARAKAELAARAGSSNSSAA